MMALEPELKATFNQTIYVATRTGLSGKGDPTYAAPVSRKVREERKRKIVTNSSGEEIASTTTIYTDLAIGMYDRIWLEGDDQNDNSLARLPLAVDKHPDEDGSVHHYEVFV